MADISTPVNPVVKLPTPAEFDFQQNMVYLSRSSDECLFTIHGHTVLKAFEIDGEAFILQVRADQEGELTLQFLGAANPLSVETIAAVTRYVRDWFDLDRDLRPFYEMARKDALLKQTVDDFFGLRCVGIPDLFETVCWGIIGQQINLAFAYTLKRRLVETYGRYVEWDSSRYWLFPSPQAIAALQPEDLMKLQMTGKKSEYLIGVARLIAKEELTKEQLLALGDSTAAEKKLVSIRGIGPWTAHYVLMRCLRYPNAFPIDDVGLHNSIRHLLGTSQKPTKDELLRLSSTWTDWEAYATFYLWRVLY
ncbi:DNA-3-methyladenine glycosylase family protein [Gorillibacterium massiliense]|uniref:DNA-3-methyladenine glycosylase family protein n=1 Tax=Gorillibacterium massiliense TaxID=1280390 RepID=UPI0004ACA7E3|nr:DNA-3-methyladenine glycosylase [Gorillibacterium massiliense]